MGCRECIALGAFIGGMIAVWTHIIYSYFSNRDKDINEETKNNDYK